MYLTRNWTYNLSVYGTTPNQLSHTVQGSITVFNNPCIHYLLEICSPLKLARIFLFKFFLQQEMQWQSNMATICFFSFMPSLLLGGNLRKKHKARNHLLELSNDTVWLGNTEQTLAGMHFKICQPQHPSDFLLGLCIIDNTCKKGWYTFPSVTGRSVLDQCSRDHGFCSSCQMRACKHSPLLGLLLNLWHESQTAWF